MFLQAAGAADESIRLAAPGTHPALGTVAGINAITLDDVKIARKGSTVVATGKVRQKDAPDDLITAVPIYANAGRKGPMFVARVFADGNETAFRLTLPAGTTRLLLDPYGTVLARP